MRGMQRVTEAWGATGARGPAPPARTPRTCPCSAPCACQGQGRTGATGARGPAPPARSPRTCPCSAPCACQGQGRTGATGARGPAPPAHSLPTCPCSAPGPPRAAPARPPPRLDTSAGTARAPGEAGCRPLVARGSGRLPQRAKCTRRRCGCRGQARSLQLISAHLGTLNVLLAQHTCRAVRCACSSAGHAEHAGCAPAHAGSHARLQPAHILSSSTLACAPARSPRSPLTCAHM